jgi:transposase-like protein
VTYDLDGCGPQIFERMAQALCIAEFGSGVAVFGAGGDQQYGAVIRLWRNAWDEFTPFLDYGIEIRTRICSTNAIESLNSRYRRLARARGHFPTEQAGR